MNISSAVIYANPQQSETVRASLAVLPGVEIHSDAGDGRFIVTVEDVADVSAADTVMQLHRLQGVLSAVMVYQYSDDDLPGEKEKS